MRVWFRRALFFGFFLTFAAGNGPAPAAAQTITEQREASVRKFRAGHTEEALGELRAMLAAGREDGFVAMDLETLLQQDGKPQEAVTVFETAARPDPPSYALLAATRAYRDLRRFDDAARLAREGLRRFPAEPIWPLTLSLAASDAGRPEDAFAALRLPAAANAPRVEWLLAEAYAWRKAGDPFQALRAYTDALKLAPADPEARTEAGRILLELGAPYGAVEIAGANPPATDDQAAALVRWGQQLRSDDPDRRFEGTDAALARLDARLAALRAPPEDAAERRQLRLNHMVALRDRVRMEEAKSEGDALRAEAPLPPYADAAYADALLYLRKPEAARDAYRRVLAATPKDVAARYGVFYASVDLEDFTTAYATIDALVADEPVWRTYRDDPTRYDNPDRAYAEVTAARARLYGNQLAEAWARITRLADAAPADANTRLALSQIAAARGWPHRATAEAEIAVSLAPRELASRSAAVETATTNHRFGDAQRLLGELQAQYPEDGEVRRLARDLDAQQRWLLDVNIAPSSSQGGGTNASGRALTQESRLMSPPIADNWRLFAGEDFANARPAEGYVYRGRAVAGVEWRDRDLTATAYPTRSWGTMERGGGGATADWLATDQLHVAAVAEWFTWETPLRALLHDITADEYAAKATYRWHESRSVVASFAYLPFSDGNRRESGGLTYKERLVNLPGFDVTGLGELYASRNSRNDAPYYNPGHDLSLTAGFLIEHVLWRRYDDSLLQALTVDGGLYSERGFDDTWIGTVKYDHRWRFDPLTELRYGGMVTRRVYDGSVETTYTFTAGGTQRF